MQCKLPILRPCRACRSLSVLAPALANLTKLQYLDLSTNELGGNLSSACGLASSGLLAELDLDNNSISGGIPACLIDAPALVELRLQGNALHGTLPAIPAASPLVTLVLGGQVSHAFKHTEMNLRSCHQRM